MDIQTLAIIATVGATIIGLISFLFKIIFGEWNFIGWLRKRRNRPKTIRTAQFTKDEILTDEDAAETPIERKGSTTAGFVGQTERGPIGPKLITSWSDFNRLYGRETDPSVSFMGLAVRGFFENGGPRAYISRVIGKKAAAALVQLSTVDERQSLKIEANSAGYWGNKLIVRIQDGTRIGFRLDVFYHHGEHAFFTSDRNDLYSYINSGGSKVKRVEEHDNLGFEPDGPN